MPVLSVSYRAITAVVPMDRVDTVAFFTDPTIRRGSPIDLFVGNSLIINKVYTSYVHDRAAWLPEIGSLVVLGYMSAVESYIRALITGLINFDEKTRERAGPKQVTFGVATRHPDPKLLPEALLENTSFSGAKAVKSAFADFLGLNNVPPDVTLALEEFDKICQLRHCCVHRFGKLGSKNAMDLGFKEHREIIERPFKPTLDNVMLITNTLTTFVRTINNFVFFSILDQTVHHGLQKEIEREWSWIYAKDRPRFLRYYDFFACTAAEPKSEPLRQVYEDFKVQHAAMIAKRKRSSEAPLHPTPPAEVPATPARR
ncbi:hypothetical protein FV219_00305 [Methylobacterium sp. WL122]|nr:hypothetical protein FV219_00305 [Methylobacterium sp. WL122]